MAEKTLYLHIGTFKTASTTIQRFCHTNREVLAEKGICYPEMPFTYSGKGNERNGLFLGHVFYDIDNTRDEETEAKRLDSGMEQLHEAFENFDTVLISDEALYRNLCHSKSKLLKMLYNDSVEYGYKIHVLLYLRRQDEFVESFWNQRVKAFKYETRDFKEYAEVFGPLDYYLVLKRFAKIIGKENITVRRFKELVKGKGVISNFLSEIGLELTDEYTVLEEKANTRLYGNAVIIKKAINSIPEISRSEHNFISEGLVQVSDITEKLYPCSEFSEEERAEFMSKFEESNALLAEQFICDGNPAFSDDYSGPQKREDNNPEFINDVIRSYMYSDLILYRRLKESEKKIRDLNKKIDALNNKVTALSNKKGTISRGIRKIKNHIPVKKSES